tara:strand:+ start:966 stop:1970 length:1005 start_codon:yes stop_codon:yes gene_type:complete
MKYFMGIETSCDETGVAILDEKSKVLSNVLYSQAEIHEKFGGVVPEIASKNHLEKIIPVINHSLETAQKTIYEIDKICVTNGPGLLSCLMVGVSTAKSLSLISNKEIVPINHLEGHIASCFIENNIEMPALCLVVSGGHTNIYYLENQFNFKEISSTLDDAAGEAFDKGAKLLGLGYPGGIKIDEISKNSKRDFHVFPVSGLGDSLDFSFSGLKTSLKYYLEKNQNWKENINHIASSYQEAIVKTLIDKVKKASLKYKPKSLLFCGGVACNSRLRDVAESELNNFKIIFPSKVYCTDNGAMIAMRGLQKTLQSEKTTPLDFLTFSTMRKTKTIS